MTSKFRIDSINILSSWGYNLQFNTECTICRNNLNEDSIYNIEANKSLNYLHLKTTSINNGICGHSFHNECINRWTSKNNNCPICSKSWRSV